MNRHIRPLNSVQQSYWENYYKSNVDQLPVVAPSQFATFTLNELQLRGIHNICEFGSGTGRDAIFFSKYGLSVIATDRSKNAISLITPKLENASSRAFCHDALNPFDFFNQVSTHPRALYARFFLHSLNDSELSIFLSNCTSSMRPGDLLFVEYRTDIDKGRPKVTPDHFRAYRSPSEVSCMAKGHELDLIYEKAGDGFAKWKNDDAHVARQIFDKVKI